MKTLHGLALTLLCVSVPGLPVAAADKAETNTAMLSAEPLSTETLRIQMLGTEPEAQSKASTTPTVAPIKAKPVPARAANSKTSAIRQAVQTQLSESFPVRAELRSDEKSALKSYYGDPGNKLLWVNDNGITERGRAVMDEIARADEFGLDARDYKLPNADDVATGSTEDRAKAELAISHAVLTYARDARGGRITPSRITRNLDPTLALPKPAEVIQSIAFRSDAAAYLRSFQPQHPQFKRLRKRLIALRGGGEETSREKPDVKIPNGPLLRLGDADAQVPLLKKRLAVPAGDMPDVFDQKLLNAVKRFQREHNTNADGVVGPGTRRLLNNPQLRHAGGVAEIKKVLLNMERWRWLPQDLGQLYVTANVPEFQVRVVEDDEIVYKTRIVAGATKTPTPVFTADMKSIVFGPFWNVPNSIKTGEIRPYIRQYGGGWYGRRWDTRVLQQHQLRIKYNGQHVDPQAIDWARVDIRKLHFYQPPSSNNVLGRVKFMFPNKHDVYMHDTRDKHYFKNSVRAESHGCMRVQNPDEFAAVLLKADQNWSAEKTKHAFNTGYDKHVALKNDIPVYVTYFTLWVNQDGSTTNYRDLYGYDRRMAGALFKRGRNYAATGQSATPKKPRQAERTGTNRSHRFARNAF